MEDTLWKLLLPWTGKRCYGNAMLACKSSARAADDPLTIARWLSHARKGGELLCAARMRRMDVFDILTGSLGCHVDANLFYTLARDDDAAALNLVLSTTSVIDPTNYFAKVSFIIACLHGCENVVKDMVKRYYGRCCARTTTVSVIDGVKDSDWMDVVGLLSEDESMNVLDMGAAMARCGGHPHLVRLIRRRQGRLAF